MSLHTTFKIGGPAEAFARPENPDSAAALMSAALAEGIPLFVLGAGANILVGDKGIRGIVLDTSRLDSTRMDSDPARAGGREAILIAGAGLSMDELCLEALARGLAGLEDFAGMPGSVGGAIFMNARCYEREMSQVLAWIDSSGRDGGLPRRFLAAGGRESGWAYKISPYQQGGSSGGELILRAGFRLARAGDETIARVARVMRERKSDRAAKGHYRLPSAGSMFKNDRSLGSPAGKLLDGLGLRGKSIGGAMVSPWHANIFVNAGIATAAEMRALIEFAQQESRSRLGVELEPEVLFIGDF